MCERKETAKKPIFLHFYCEFICKIDSMKSNQDKRNFLLDLTLFFFSRHFAGIYIIIASLCSLQGESFILLLQKS